jgi:hypothetical protein
MVYEALILAVGLIVAGPALAEGSNGTTAAQPAATANVAAKAPRADTTKYCVEVEASTGSLIKTTECKTRAEWARQGVYIDQLKNN